MTREEMKVIYEKIYAWMTILNMREIFTEKDEDKPKYSLIGKIWSARKNYVELENIFYDLYKQGVHKKYEDEPKHIFSILMIALKKRKKGVKKNGAAATIINM